MRINGIYPTYVYNTNYVSAKSLGKVDAIPDDALSGKTGYTSSGENTNPLRPGTSKDFAGIVASQMATGRMRAARFIKPQTAAGTADTQKTEDDENRSVVQKAEGEQNKPAAQKVQNSRNKSAVQNAQDDENKADAQKIRSAAADDIQSRRITGFGYQSINGMAAMLGA